MIAEAIEPKANVEEKIQDVFEIARRAFFSAEDDKESPLSETEKFTQVKSFDAPQLDGSGAAKK